VMFISISRYAFHKQIRDNKSFKSVALVMGFALAIGASTAASNFGFSLGDLGPLALAVVLLMFGWMFYQLIVGLGVGGFQAAALAYLVAFGFLTTAASGLFEFIQDEAATNTGLGLLDAMLQLMFILAFFAVIYGVVRWGMRNFRSEGGGDDEDAPEGETPQEEGQRRRRRAQEEADTEDVEEETEEAEEETAEAAVLSQQAQQMAEEITRINAGEKEPIRNLTEWINRINNMTPEQAQKMVEQHGAKIITIIDDLLDYSKRARKLITVVENTEWHEFEKVKGSRTKLHEAADKLARDELNAQEDRKTKVTHDNKNRIPDYTKLVAENKDLADGLLKPIVAAVLADEKYLKTAEGVVKEIEEKEELAKAKVQESITAAQANDAAKAKESIRDAMFALRDANSGVTRVGTLMIRLRKRIKDNKRKAKITCSSGRTDCKCKTHNECNRLKRFIIPNLLVERIS